MVPTKDNTILIIKLILAKNTLSNSLLLLLVITISMLDLWVETKPMHNTYILESVDSFSRDSLAPILLKTALKFFKGTYLATLWDQETVSKWDSA